jgi:hypothetical protein
MIVTRAVQAPCTAKSLARNISALRRTKVFRWNAAALLKHLRHSTELLVWHNRVYGTNQTQNFGMGNMPKRCALDNNAVRKRPRCQMELRPKTVVRALPEAQEWLEKRWVAADLELRQQAVAIQSARQLLSVG